MQGCGDVAITGTLCTTPKDGDGVIEGLETVTPLRTEALKPSAKGEPTACGLLICLYLTCYSRV